MSDKEILERVRWFVNNEIRGYETYLYLLNKSSSESDHAHLLMAQSVIDVLQKIKDLMNDGKEK